MKHRQPGELRPPSRWAGARLLASLCLLANLGAAFPASGGAPAQRASTIIAGTQAASAPTPPPNVLLICVDDLRPVLGCYGGPAKTPNLDRFFQTAAAFTRHYVQFPSCGPSRASMLGGVRPDAFRVYGNGGVDVIARQPQQRPTLPLHFRNHGYATLSFGKIYHGKGAGDGFGWSEPPWHPPSWTCYVNFQQQAPQKGKEDPWRPAFEIYDGPDHLHGDYQTADQVLAALEKNRSRPFFIAAGFYKPHLPFVAPQRYWDLYDHDAIDFVEPRDIPAGAATFGYAFREICSYGDQEGRMFSPEAMPTPAQTKDLIHAYYAAVSFTDSHIGRILNKLDVLQLRNNTAVVVWSDHGFHLGDQARWAKWTQFEADMRSPLMIRLPGLAQRSGAVSALVESVDVYPTLADYCGIGLPAHLEGTSLLPLIAGEVDEIKQVARSQVAGLRSNNHLMAYSLRTPQHRYVEWRDRSRQNELVETELYDLGPSGAETVNVASDPSRQDVLDACRKLVAQSYASLQTAAAADPPPPVENANPQQ